MHMRPPAFSLLPQPTPMPLAGRRVLVLGLGDTGVSVARWVCAQGGQVRAADTRAEPPGQAVLAEGLPQVPVVTGAFAPGLVDGVDLVCVSPGLSLEQPVVREALVRGVPVVGDIELFAWHLRALRSVRVLAVTGTNGKTTVTALAGHLLRSAGVDAEVAGNIGPAALEALRRREAAGEAPDAWVLELSSYQLETTWSLAPDAAALLNLSEDHLDRYAGLAEYGAAKARILFGAQCAVLNRGDPWSAALADASRRECSFGLDAPAGADEFGLKTVEGRPWLCHGAHRMLALDELPLHGLHNAANALAASALASAAGLGDAAIADGLRSFRGLPHRLQRIAVRRGVDWYDDSKGTNVGATIAALRGLGRRAVLIAGGDGKGQDFAPLADAVSAHATQVLLIGRDRGRIAAALKGTGIPLAACDSLEAAVRAADTLVRPGEAVLLSPACASFDMFRDYRHRGAVFAQAVHALDG